MKKTKKYLLVILLMSLTMGIINGNRIKKDEDPVLTLKFYNNDYTTHVGLLYYFKSDSNDSPTIPFGYNNNIKVGIWFLPGIDFANKTTIPNNMKK